MARRRREISFPLVLVLSRCFVFVFVCVSSSGFFTTINLCKEHERKLTAFNGGVSVRFTRWPPFDVSAAESLLSPRLDPISDSTGRSLLPSQCLPPHTSYLHGVSRDDAIDQIWGLYRSGKQIKPDLALRPPSRYKPTKNHSATNPATELPHQPNKDAADQIWRLNRSGKQTKSDPVSLDDAAAQIWGFFRSGKQIKPVPALRPSSRHSATNLSPVSHLKETPASTQHPVRPSIMTPASTQQLGGGASDTSTTGAALGFGLLGLRHCSGPPWLSRPNDEHTISSTSLIRPKTKPLFPNYVEMYLLDCLPRSESFAYDLAQESQMVYDRRPPMSSVTLFI